MCCECMISLHDNQALASAGPSAERVVICDKLGWIPSSRRLANKIRPSDRPFRAMSKSRPSSVTVLWEDQERICRFGRLNAKLHEIEADIKKQQAVIADLDDAAAELMLADDDEAARLMIGNSFWVTPTEDAEAKLEQLTEAAKTKMASLEEAMGGVKEEMAGLKVKLYATFGSNINLEE